MARHGSTYQYVVLFGEYFHYLQAFHLYALTAHAAGHAHSLEYAGRIGRPANGTRCTATVMLAVRSLAHAGKAMAFYHALEAFSFRGAYYIHQLAFGKDVTGDDITQRLFNVVIRITKFAYDLFRSRIGFREVMLERLGGIFFFALTESNLKGTVSIRFFSLHLGYGTRTSFDNGAGYLLAIWRKYAGHADLFSNDPFHDFYFTQRLRVFELSSG